MKKFIGLAMMLIYMFTASSLVHASTMGVFPHHTSTNVSHCHENTDTQKHNTSKQNMSCCEQFSNHQYSEVKIDFEQHIKTFGHNQYVYLLPEYIQISNTKISKRLIGYSPGQNTRSKYMKFADLFGSIVILS